MAFVNDNWRACVSTHGLCCSVVSTKHVFFIVSLPLHSAYVSKLAVNDVCASKPEPSTPQLVAMVVSCQHIQDWEAHRDFVHAHHKRQCTSSIRSGLRMFPSRFPTNRLCNHIMQTTDDCNISHVGTSVCGECIQLHNLATSPWMVWSTLCDGESTRYVLAQHA